MFLVKRAILGLPFCALFVVLGAQQRQPTFTSKTSVVTLNVIALDRDGKPVAGLTAADFEVRINGKVQPIHAVAYLDVPDAALKAAPMPDSPEDMSILPSRRAAENAAPTRDARVFVVVVDDLSFEPGQGKPLFVSAEAFVSRLPTTDYVGFALTSGAQTVNPATDRRPVVAALKAAVGQFMSPARVHADPPVVSIGEAMQIESGNTGVVHQIMLRECYDPKTAATMTNVSVDGLTRMSPCAAVVPFRANQIAAQLKAMRQRQIQSLASLIGSLRGVVGIKHVVILSNGFAVTRDINDFEPIARAAAIAGVQISTMVQEGDIDLADIGSSVEVSGGGSTPVSPGQAQRRREDDVVLTSGAQTMTDMAGGQFYRVIGQPLRFFERVATSASAVYRLGVELPPGLVPGKALAVSAGVKRPGVSVLTSQHAATPTVGVVPSAEDLVKSALNTGEMLYGVPVRLAAIVRRASTPGLLEIGASASTPVATSGPVSFSIGLVDRLGGIRTAKRVGAAGASDHRATLAIPVTPGLYQLRVAAVDNNGNVGAVSLAVSAELTRIDSLLASDVLLWATDSKGNMQLLPFEDVPEGAASVTAMVELYAESGRSHLLEVRFAIIDTEGRTVTESQGTVTLGANGIARADAPLAIASLPAGRYAVRASVGVDGKAAGAVATRFQRR